MIPENLSENDPRPRSVFVPVGTSLLAPRILEATGSQHHIQVGQSCFHDFRSDLLRGDASSDQQTSSIEWHQWKESCDSHLRLLFDSYCRVVDPDQEMGLRRGRSGTGLHDQQHPALLSAELASLYLLFERSSNMPPQHGDEVILLASDTGEGLYCACFLAEYLRLKPPYSLFAKQVYIERIVHLQGQDSRSFQQQGINNLIDVTLRRMREHMDRGRDIYLNITGGYKGALPHLVLLGQALGRIRSFYLYEMSPDIIFLPELPVGFDLLTWRDYRGFINTIEHIPELDEHVLSSLVPPAMVQLFERESAGGFSLSTLGTVLRQQYEKSKGKEISEYGRGYLLANHIGDRTRKRALKDCIDRWQHLWLGDLIPETVEHGRGHAQRDLELLAQIIHPVLRQEGKDTFFGGRGDDNLVALLAAVWLHDLGHSGGLLQCDLADGRLCEGTRITRDVRQFPSLVRGLHHLLSWHLIGEDREDLFATRYHREWRRDRSVFSDQLIGVIRQICLYHRGNMPVIAGDSAYSYMGLEIAEPLQNLQSGVVNVPLLGALLRMADAGDIQRERTVSGEYEGMRTLQNKREIEGLVKRENQFRKMAKAVSGSGSCPPYIKRVLRDVDSYFSSSCKKCFLIDDEFETLSGRNIREITRLRELESRSQQEYADTYLDRLIDWCAQKFAQGDGLADLPDEQKLILENWLGTASQYMFKIRQPEHFNKHRGISAVMYLPDRVDRTDKGDVYHFRVLVVYTEQTSADYAQSLLDGEIFAEYERVQPILRENRICFEWDKSKVVQLKAT